MGNVTKTSKTSSNCENISQFSEIFIKIYKEESDKGYFLKVDVKYTEKLQKLHNDLPFLPERMKIEKVEKLVANLHDKTEYVINIRILKQALNHRLVLKKVHRVIKFNQNARLKTYWYEHRSKKKAKNDFEKGFFTSMNNACFEKSYGKCEKR